MALVIRYFKYARRDIEIAREAAPTENPDDAVEYAKRRLHEIRLQRIPAADGVQIEDGDGNVLREFVFNGRGGL